MEVPSLEVIDLRKTYRVYADSGARVREWLGRGRRVRHQAVEALHGVSFALAPGSFTGLVGPNGSGKTTLLRLLAGLSPVTGGTVRVRGRVAALLQLGAGFHQDFSGRENIRMGAALMGLSRAEVARRFDAIAAFSELGEALDRPVRTYSQGMLLRLGFSIATAVDPDVILVDEVLSVGDLRFQQKCLDRFRRFRDDGKTILYASHDLGVIRILASEVLWLDHGRLVRCGPSQPVVDAYEAEMRARDGRLPHADAAAGAAPADEDDGQARLEGFTVQDGAGRPATEFRTGDALHVEVAYRLRETPAARASIGVLLHRNDGVTVTIVGNHFDAVPLVPDADGRGRLRLELPALALLGGRYAVSVHLVDQRTMHIYDRRDFAAEFHVVTDDRREMGLVRLERRWVPLPAAAEAPAVCAPEFAAPLG